MRPVAREAIAERIEQLEVLDPVADVLQAGVRRAIPQDSPVKDLLSGTWLGHPLHPMLTDVVIGAWTSAWFLDFIPDDDAARDAARRLVGIGVVSAAPTAVAGLSDWAELSGPVRRVGSVHAIGNSTALALYTLSWLARRRGDHRRGIALGMLGSAVATFSGWLGGHLSFARGVGVSQSVFEKWPTEWTPVLRNDELEDGKLTPATADGVGIVLVRRGGTVHALLDRCPHRGCPLHRGELSDDSITCACHGSTFRLDGTLVKGPSVHGQTALEVRERDATIEVRGPERVY